MEDKKRLEALQRNRQTSLNRLLLLARRNVMQQIRRMNSDGRLSEVPPAYAALLPYIDLQGTRPSQMAERAEVSKQAISKAIGKLESLGLVYRSYDHDDRRASLVHYTEAGIECLLDVHQAIDKVENDIEQAIGADNLLKIKHHLEIISKLDTCSKTASAEARTYPKADQPSLDSLEESIAPNE